MRSRTELLWRSNRRCAIGAALFLSLLQCCPGSAAVPIAPVKFHGPDQRVIRGFRARYRRVQAPAPVTEERTEGGSHRVPLTPPALSELNKLLSQGDAAREQHEYERALQIYRYAARQNTVSPLPLLKSADLLWVLARTEDAKRDLQKTLLLDPDSAKAYHLLGLIALGRGNIDDAQKLLSKAVLLDDNDVDSHRKLADIYARSGQTSAADSEYEKVLQLDPADVQARTNLAAHLASREKLTRALKLMEDGHQLTGQHAQEELQLALLYTQTGLSSDAIESFKHARDLDPHNSEPFELLAITSGARHDWASAYDYAQSFLDVDPGNVNAVLLLAWTAYAGGELHEAKSRVDEALAICPDNADLHNLRALILIDLRRDKEAQIELEQALKLQPHNLAVQMNQITLGIIEEQYETAANQAQELLRQYPDMRPLKALTAYADACAGRNDNARTLANSVLSERDTDELSRIALARVLRSAGRTWQAVDELKKGWRNGDSSAFYNTELAQALFDNGNFKAAEEVAQDALQIAPQNLTAKRILALSLGQQGNWDGALLYLRETVARSPRDLFLRMALARAFASKGDFDLAQDAYEAARKMAPNSPAPLTGLAEIAGKQHKKLLARKLQKQADALTRATADRNVRSTDRSVR